MTDEIRECPFCGGKGIEQNEKITSGIEHFPVFHFIECDRCSARGPRFTQQGTAWTAKSFARNNWNLRMTVMRGVKK